MRSWVISSTQDASRSRHDFGPSNSENEGKQPFQASCIGVAVGAGPSLPRRAKSSLFCSILLPLPAFRLISAGQRKCRWR